MDKSLAALYNLTKLGQKRTSQNECFKKSKNRTTNDINPAKFMKKLSENANLQKEKTDSMVSLEERVTSTCDTEETGSCYTRKTNRPSITMMNNHYINNLTEEEFIEKYEADPFFRIKIKAMLKDNEGVIFKKKEEQEPVSAEDIKQNEPSFYSTLKGKREMHNQKIKDIFTMSLTFRESFLSNKNP